MPEPTFYRVIVERTGPAWRAWFDDAPHLRLTAAGPTLAAEQLAAVFGERDLDPRSMTLDPTNKRPGRLEFMLRPRPA